MKRRITWIFFSCVISASLAAACGQNPNLTVASPEDPTGATGTNPSGPEARATPTPGPPDGTETSPIDPPGNPPPGGPNPIPTPDCEKPHPASFVAYRISNDRFRTSLEIETSSGPAPIEFSWETDLSEIVIPLGALAPECPKPEPKPEPSWEPKPPAKPPGKPPGPTPGPKPSAGPSPSPSEPPSPWEPKPEPTGQPKPEPSWGPKPVKPKTLRPSNAESTLRGAQ